MKDTQISDGLKEAFNDIEDHVHQMLKEHNESDVVLSMISWVSIIAIAYCNGDTRRAHDLLSGPYSEKALKELKVIMEKMKKKD